MSPAYSPAGSGGRTKIYIEMGRSEIAFAAVAAVSTLRDLVSDLGETQAYAFLRERENEPIVIDENGYQNRLFHELLGEDLEPAEFFEKARLFRELMCTKDGRESVNTDTEECLWTCDISILAESLGQCERWGYGRDGTNISCVEFPDLLEVRSQLEQKAKAMNLRTYRIKFTTGVSAG
jgi:hypothetical protein